MALDHCERRSRKITANDNDSLVSDADLAEIGAFANGDALVCA